MPGKGQRRRLRNQKLARTQIENLKSGNFFVSDFEGPTSKNKAKEDLLPKSLRRIMAFTEGLEKGKDEEKKASKEVASVNKNKNAKQKAENKGTEEGKSNSKSIQKKKTTSNESKNVKSNSGTPLKDSQKHERGKGKASKNGHNAYKFVQDDAKNSRLKLVAAKGQKRKKGYLDIRKEKKKMKKIRDQEDDDLNYDKRAFFDEVAYEPPRLALQKARQMMR